MSKKQHGKETEANLPVTHDLTIFPVETKDEFPDGPDYHCSHSCFRNSLGLIDYLWNDKEFLMTIWFGRDCQHSGVGIQLLNFQREVVMEEHPSSDSCDHGGQYSVFLRVKSFWLFWVSSMAMKQLTASVIADRGLGLPAQWLLTPCAAGKCGDYWMPPAGDEGNLSESTGFQMFLRKLKRDY